MQAAELEYEVGMYGQGKYALDTRLAALVIVAVVPVEVVVVVLPVPRTAPLVVVPVVRTILTVPVHFALVGQQATLFALSVVHEEPTVQHAPASLPEQAL